MDWSQIGNLSLNFIMDGATQSANYTVQTGNPQTAAQVTEKLTEPNFMWYQNPEVLAFGEHTLVVEVTECDTVPFILDYFTFNIQSSPTPLPTSGRSKKGSIAGGVVGGMVFVLLLAFVFNWYQRRKRRMRTRTRFCKYLSFDGGRLSPYDASTLAYPFRQDFQADREPIPLEAIPNEYDVKVNAS